MENQNFNQNQAQGHQGQNQYQNQYQPQNQGYATNYTAIKNQSVVSIGDWVITIILTAIPFVNIIMLLVWAFGGGTPESKSNWAKASLIFYLISIILVICFYGSIAAMFLGAAAFS